MTNRDLYSHMWFWGIVFSIGIGVLSGYLAADGFCYSYYNGPLKCYSNGNAYRDGVNAGISLTVIGGVFGLWSCIWLGRRLEIAERTNTNLLIARNTNSIATTVAQNQGATELNPLGQETRNQGTEINPNHEAIELSPLGQEVRNLGAEVTNSEQEQNQQIIDLQRRLTQLENQINQQHEARIEVIPSSV